MSASSLLRTSLAVLCLAAAACAAAPQAVAQTPAPIGLAGWAPDGQAHARETCARCHAVEPGEEISPYPGAPAFEQLAETPGMTGMALNVWLHSAHEEMPHLMVDRDDVEDLSAYITSLKDR